MSNEEKLKSILNFMKKKDSKNMIVQLKEYESFLDHSLEYFRRNDPSQDFETLSIFYRLIGINN